MLRGGVQMRDHFGGDQEPELFGIKKSHLEATLEKADQILEKEGGAAEGVRIPSERSQGVWMLKLEVKNLRFWIRMCQIAEVMDKGYDVGFALAGPEAPVAWHYTLGVISTLQGDWRDAFHQLRDAITDFAMAGAIFKLGKEADLAKESAAEAVRRAELAIAHAKEATMDAKAGAAEFYRRVAALWQSTAAWFEREARQAENIKQLLETKEKLDDVDGYVELGKALKEAGELGGDKGEKSQEEKGEDQKSEDQTGEDQTGEDQTGEDQTGEDQTGEDKKKKKKKKKNPLLARATDDHFAVTTRPDVCLTPEPMDPVPYGLIREYGNAQNVSKTVFALGTPCFLAESFSPDVEGDEPGTGGGIKSGTNVNIAEANQIRPKIKIEGRPVTYEGAKQYMNKRNQSEGKLFCKK
jgi:hypothetical protein